MDFKKLAQTNLITAMGIGLAVVAALLVAPATSHADTMYVSIAAGNNVEKFDTLSGVGTIFATNGLDNPEGVAFDNAGNLYVDNYSSNTIEKFDTNGNGSVFANTGLSALGMVFDKAGNLFVANWDNNNIEKFDTNGNGSVFADGSSGLDAPIGLIFDSAGFLYVANWVNSTIEKFDTNGNGSVFASSGLNGPEGMAFDSAGNLYVANSGGWSQFNPGSGSIEKFDTNGNGSVFASGLYFPCGLAFDSAGNLYATSRGNSNNLIYKFTPAGVESVFANTPGAYPEFIVIQPGLGSVTLPPSITSQPQPTTVTTGNNASFNVTATGTPSLYYQWSFNGTNISGTTTSSLTISNVSQTDSGTYAVVISNTAGSVTSSNAMLAVWLLPIGAQAAGHNQSGIIGLVETPKWTVEVLSESNNLAAYLEGDREGLFKMDLQPGNYVLTPFTIEWPTVGPGQPTPNIVTLIKGPSKTVKVVKNRFTIVGLPTEPTASRFNVSTPSTLGSQKR